MRRSLDPLCRLSVGAAAFCLFMIAVTSVGQSIGRVVGITMNSTESVGFILAGSGFLAPACTLRTGGHIRVSRLLARSSYRWAWPCWT